MLGKDFRRPPLKALWLALLVFIVLFVGWVTNTRQYPLAIELFNPNTKTRFAEVDPGTSEEDEQTALEVAEELREARRLRKEVKLLCWVLMPPKSHQTIAVHIKATWGRRCDKLIFMSTEDDPSVGAVNIGSMEGYFYALWNKTRCALRYIYNNHLYEYDWFLKADSDTYVVVDNVRYMLAAYNTDDPIYFGQYYKAYGGYNTGGSGYVLGREAIRRFVEKAMPRPDICQEQRRKGEDVGLGVCLQNVGVKFGDTRDHLGRGRFWQRSLADVFNFPQARENYTYYKVPKGESPDACCSDTIISTHKRSVTDLYLLDYYFYKVRVFGHIPTLPLKIQLPPDLSVVPDKTKEKYREYEKEQGESK